MSYKNIDEAIAESGNNLHIRVIDYLKKDGWEVSVSTYYRDDIQDVPREIDIIAVKSEMIQALDVFDQGNRKKFTTVLVIECKYFADDVAFRMFPNDKSKVNDALLWDGFINKQDIFRPDGIKHHYNDAEFIAVLYDTIKSEHNKSIFDAITQPIKALTFLLDSQAIKSDAIVYYPVVVYGTKNKVYTLEGSDLNNKKETEQFLFGLNYAYQNRSNGRSGNKFYYIDFLHENKLSKYIEDLKKETQPIKDDIVYKLSGR
jgi:hypothetical protein